MRYDVKKYLFIGLEEEREGFYKAAQNVGIIHFIENGTTSTKEIPEEITATITAIKILRSLPVLEQVEPEDAGAADDISHKILTLKHSLEALAEQSRTLRLEIERIAPFGDFSPEDLAFIEREGKRKIQFFFGRQGSAAELELPDEVIYVTSAHGLDYFVAINPEPKQYKRLVEIRIEQPIGALRKQRHDIEQQLHHDEHELKTYAKYNHFLHQILIHKLNHYHLRTAKNAADPALENTLFTAKGWVSVNKVEELLELTSRYNIYLSEIVIEPTDAVPTYLENYGINRMGEDVIHIYDTPSITDKDPSLWVLLSFAFFFAFIIGDAGYGTLFLGVALYLRYRFSKGLHGVKRRVLNLVTLLCFACIAWGVLTTSFFGISFSPDSPIRKVSLLTWLVEKKTAYHMEHHDEVYQYWVAKYPQLSSVKDPAEFVRRAATVREGNVKYDLMAKFSDNIMLELALLIGIVHIIISLARYMNRNWAAIGWIAFIIGGYLYLPHYLQGTSILYFVFDLNREEAAREGIYLLTGGLSVAIILSIIKHKLLGLTEVMTSVQIFADILSYLRLYALALAGAIISETINDSAVSLSFVLGGVLILAGHAINMVMAIMSGLIHGLRLNFLEWYHYSFEGGGKRFRPLKKVDFD